MGGGEQVATAAGEALEGNEGNEAVERPTRAQRQLATDGKCVQLIGLRKVYPPRGAIFPPMLCARTTFLWETSVNYV